MPTPDTVESLTAKVRRYTQSDSTNFAGIQSREASFDLRQALDCITTHCIPTGDTVLQEELLQWTANEFQE